MASPATTGDLTNKKYIEWLTDKNGLNSNLHSDPTSLPKIHGTIMCLDQVSPGNDPWKWVIKLEKTLGVTQIASGFLVKESSPSPARTSTTASSTTTVLPDPPIPCLAPGAHPAAGTAMDGGSDEPFGDVNKKDGHWTNMAMVTMIGLNFRLAFVTKCRDLHPSFGPF